MKERTKRPLIVGGLYPFLCFMVVLFPIGKEDRRSKIEGDKNSWRIGKERDPGSESERPIMYHWIDAHTALLSLLRRKQREIVFDFTSRPFATLMDTWARWYGPWMYRLNVDLMSGRA